MALTAKWSPWHPQRATLTLAQRVKVKWLSYLTRGSQLRRSLIKWKLGRCSKCCWTNETITVEYYSSGAPSTKILAVRKTGLENFNELVCGWFKVACSKRIPATNGTLQDCAWKFTETVNLDNFAACNGCLTSTRQVLSCSRNETAFLSWWSLVRAPMLLMILQVIRRVFVHSDSGVEAWQYLQHGRVWNGLSYTTRKDSYSEGREV